MMSNVVQFPKTVKEDRDKIREVNDELISQGIYTKGKDIPPDLAHFIIEWWGHIYDAGYAEGKYEQNI